jgi:hypothetical protein
MKEMEVSQANLSTNVLILEGQIGFFNSLAMFYKSYVAPASVDGGGDATWSRKFGCLRAALPPENTQNPTL